MATLEARRLQMRFGDRVVLEEFATFRPVWVHRLMGPNGAARRRASTFSTDFTADARPVLLDGKTSPVCRHASSRAKGVIAVVPALEPLQRFHRIG